MRSQSNQSAHLLTPPKISKKRAALSAPLTQPKKTKTTTIPWLNLHELSSVLIQHNADHAIKIDKNFLHTLFSNNELWLDWPLKNETRSILISYDKPKDIALKDTLEFKFSDQANSKPFLTLLVYPNGIDLSCKLKAQKNWTLPDIQDVWLFMRRAFFPHIKDADDKQSSLEKNSKRKILNEKEYKKLINMFSERSTWRRIYQAYFAPATRIKQEYVFNISFKTGDFQIIVSSSHYESYVRSEKNMLEAIYPEQDIPTKMQYLKITALQKPSLKNQYPLQVLQIFSTWDGKWTNLHTIKRPHGLTGIASLQLFEHLCQKVLCPTIIDLQDLAHKHINNEVNIPIRFFSALAADHPDSYTWYMKNLGVKPMDIKKMPSGWNEKLYFSQSSQHYYQAVQGLQMITLAELKSFLPEKENLILNDLIKHYNISDVAFSKTTIKTLINLVLANSKQHEGNAVTDFKLLMELFNLNQYYCSLENEIAKIDLQDVINILSALPTTKFLSDTISTLFNKLRVSLFTLTPNTHLTPEHLKLTDITLAQLKFAFEKNNFLKKDNEVKDFNHILHVLEKYYRVEAWLITDSPTKETHISTINETAASSTMANTDKLQSFHRNIYTLFHTRFFEKKTSRENNDNVQKLAVVPAK